MIGPFGVLTFTFNPWKCVGAGGVEQGHPLAHVMAVTVVRPAADEIAVHEARRVHLTALAAMASATVLVPVG